MPLGETIVALSSPPGESAIAAIRLSGPLCPALAEGMLDRPAPPPRRAVFGRLKDAGGAFIDEAVCILYPEGGSYTGEAMLEIFPHGSPYIAQKIIEDCVARGCRIAEPGEFTKAAFLSGRIDLSQAEAVIDVIRARSDRALEAAQRQLNGSVGKAVAELADSLLGVIARLEAYIDFPDEDLPPEDAEGPARELAELGERMSRLIATGRYGAALRDGVKTVIVGAPNVGKSSLLNALAGQERVIVSEEPGATRDYVEERIHAGPWLLRIIDTAGLRENAESIEKLGIEKSLEQAGSADLLLIVLDATLPPPALPPAALEKLDSRCAIIVENKIDLPGSDKAAAALPGLPRIRLSAKTGQGVEGLRAKIGEMLESDIVPAGAHDIIVNARHAGALEIARASCASARDQLRGSQPPELAASDLRAALEALESIVGKIDNERMLDKLFASFCIGK